MHADKVILLRHKSTYVGVRKGSNQYVVGFFKPSLVHMTKRVIDVSRELRLERTGADVVNALLMGQDEAPVPKPGDMAIDLSTQLIVPTLTDPRDSGVEPEFFSAKEFFRLPYQRNLGVVIPDEALEAEGDHWLFQVQVIDPCEDIDEFRRRLATSMRF